MNGGVASCDKKQGFGDNDRGANGVSLSTCSLQTHNNPIPSIKVPNVEGDFPRFFTYLDSPPKDSLQSNCTM